MFGGTCMLTMACCPNNATCAYDICFSLPNRPKNEIRTNIVDKNNYHTFHYLAQYACFTISGSSFSACDVTLGVILNRLSLLGLQIFWSNRKFVRRFFKDIRTRQSFVKAVPEIGQVDAMVNNWHKLYSF